MSRCSSKKDLQLPQKIIRIGDLEPEKYREVIKGSYMFWHGLLFNHKIPVSMVLSFTCSICLMKVKSVLFCKSFESIL